MVPPNISITNFINNRDINQGKSTNISNNSDINIIEDDHNSTDNGYKNEVTDLTNADDDSVVIPTGVGDEHQDNNGNDTETLPPTLRRSSRTRNPIQRLDPHIKGPTHGKTTLVQPSVPINEHIAHIALVQLSLKKGIQKYKEDGINAVKSELSQLHKRRTFIPIKQSSLSESEKRKVLESHLLLSTEEVHFN